MLMVCPDCGSSRFTQQRTALIEYTMAFEHGQWVDVSDDVLDGGDRDTQIDCAECGHEDILDDDLVTEDAYNEADE